MLYWYVGAFNRCSSREEQYLRWLLLYKNYILDCRQTTKFNSSIMKVELFILMRKSFSAFNFFQLLMKLVSSCYTSLWTQCICQINFPCLLQIRLRKSSRWNYIGFLTVSCKYHNWFLNVFFLIPLWWLSFAQYLACSNCSKNYCIRCCFSNRTEF